MSYHITWLLRPNAEALFMEQTRIAEEWFSRYAVSARAASVTEWEEAVVGLLWLRGKEAF